MSTTSCGWTVWKKTLWRELSVKAVGSCPGGSWSVGWLVLTPRYLRIVALKKCNIFAKVFQKSIPGFQNSPEMLFAFLTLDNFMGDERHRCPQIQP